MRKRTCRAALLSMLVGVLVTSGCDHAPTASPDPPASTSTALTALTAAQVLEGDLESHASRDGVETLSVWEVCAPRCEHRWVLSGATPEAIVGDAGRGPVPAVTATRTAYVVKAFGRPGFVVRPDGTTLPLQQGTTPPRIDADTVILEPDGGASTAVDPARATTWDLPALPGNASIFEASVDGDGTVWAIPADQGVAPSLYRLRDGGWQSTSMSGSYPADTIQQGIATYGRAETPPAMLMVSTDTEQTWRRLVDDGTPFSLGDSMAIVGSTLYVSGVTGRVWRTVDPGWTRLVPVDGLRGVTGLQPAGDRVVGRLGRSDGLVTVDQAGRVQVISFEEESAEEQEPRAPSRRST